MRQWLAALRIYADRRMALMLALGFSSGLPRLLTFSTLAYWLTLDGISIENVGYFAATLAPYSLKFLWAPVIDRMRLPIVGRLGQRRSWMLVTQLGLVWTLGAMAMTFPAFELREMAYVAAWVVFFSASQDIVIDAYRIDLLSVDEQGAGVAVLVYGYRIAMYASGTAVFAIFALTGSMHTFYFLMAGCMLVGVVTTLLAPEPGRPADEPGADTGVAATLARHLREGVVSPLRDLLRRRGWLLILLLVALFKLGDALAGAMTNPLLADLRFEPDVIFLAKNIGTVATLAGLFVGGWFVRAVGVVPALWVSGLLQMASNLMFSLLAWAGAGFWLLTLTLCVENLTGALGTVAFVAYLSGLCSKRYSATQYALLTALSGLLRLGLSAGSGIAAQALGWPAYFAATAAAALPGLLMLYMLRRWQVTGLTAPSIGEAK